MLPTLCTICGASVESTLLHERWHADQTEAMRTLLARLDLSEAHVENLIERMHVIEEAIDGGPEDVYDDGFDEVRFEQTAEAMRAQAEAKSYGA